MSEENENGLEESRNFTTILFESGTTPNVSESPYHVTDSSHASVRDFIMSSPNSTLAYYSTESNYINATLDEELIQAQERQVTQFYVGVGLSIASSVFIGGSFIIKKKALIRLSKGGKRANQGGYGYLKDLLWWGGLIFMAVGEAANFMAYTFAPASLVSTLGVLSVLVTAILSSKYLRERLNFLGKMGCFLCTIGSTVIVLHAPMEKDIASMDDLQSKLTNVTFVLYVLLTIVISLILIYHYLPKIPGTSTYTLLIWIGVCSMIGSLSVMSVKGIGLALMQTVTGTENQLGHWLTWFCLISLVICVSVQMNFLNKALDTFNTAVVTPIYYVFFTTCVIIASAILFNEFSYLPLKDWVGLVCGFLTVLIAIFLLHLCKNFDFTLHHLTQQIDIVNEHSSNDKPMPPSTRMISIKEMDLKESQSGFKSDDDDDDDLDDIYASMDSYKSSKNISLTLTPDVKLLYTPDKGRRNKEGYVTLSYGTTDETANHQS